MNVDGQHEPRRRTSMPMAPISTNGRQYRADATASPARQTFVRATLAVAGGTAVAIGAAIAIVPRAFIDIDGEPSAGLLSETRAPGVALLFVGVFIMAAAARRQHLHAAAWMAALTFLGYGVARIASLIVDGRPPGTILAATVIELAIGIASLIAVSASKDSAAPTGRSVHTGGRLRRTSGSATMARWESCDGCTQDPVTESRPGSQDGDLGHVFERAEAVLDQPSNRE
jgi:hypothetical protein